MNIDPSTPGLDKVVGTLMRLMAKNRVLIRAGSDSYIGKLSGETQPEDPKKVVRDAYHAGAMFVMASIGSSAMDSTDENDDANFLENIFQELVAYDDGALLQGMDPKLFKDRKPRENV